MEISVILPMYNVEKYIDRCVQSIIKQTFKDFELIIIDDGSTDKCGEICDEYAKKDSRIKVYHRKNCGAAAERNFGISVAAGEYICLLDSDDFIFEDYLEQLYNAAKEKKTKIAICNFVNFNDGEEEPSKESCGNKGFCPYVKTGAIEEYISDNDNYEKYVVVWTKIYHRSVFENIRFPEDKTYDDSYVYYYFLDKENDIAFVDDVLYARRQNPNSITHQAYSPKWWEMVECKMEQAEYFYLNNKQRVVEITYDLMMYYFWFCLNGMHRAGINDEKSIRLYQNKLRKTVKLLRPTKTFSLLKIIRQYYIVYLKKIV